MAINKISKIDSHFNYKPNLDKKSPLDHRNRQPSHAIGYQLD
jgi:hypothetical protein